MKNIVLGCLISILAILASCTSPELLGVELLNDDTINIDFTDTIHPVVGTKLDDSIVVFATNGFNIINYTNFVLGEFNDAVFGKSKSDLYLTSGIQSSSLPDFEGVTLDSLVMVLPLDTTSRYGDTFAMHNIRVHRLIEFPSSSPVIADRIDTVYTDMTYAYDSEPIGNIDLIPRYFDSVMIYSPTLDSVVTSKPQLRIRLDDAFAMEILDTTFVQTDSSYQSNVRGFFLTSTPDVNSYIGLNLQSFSSSSTNALLAMYYTDGDGVKQLYNFALGTFKSSNFQHDYAGSEVELALNSGSNTKAYVQGMAGVKTTIDLSSVMQFQGQGINFAQLEITLSSESLQNQDEEAPIPELLAFYINDSGKKTLIEDISASSSQITQDVLFDGSLFEQTDSGITKYIYRLGITNHIINILNNEISTTEIELIPRGKLETAARAIMIGNSGDADEIKLKLILTIP